MKILATFFSNVRRYLSSPRFLYIIAGLFIIMAGWIAFSSKFPMAFDEDYHFGIIKLYAQHHSPFWSTQPLSADVFGGVTRDPSFLYHYIFSWLFELVQQVTKSQYAQVISLRFINIIIFTSAIFLLKKLFLTLGVSRSVAHVVLFVILMLPLSSMLAAQINYDNMLFLVTAGILLLAMQFIKRLRAGIFDARQLICVLALGLFGSLVKFAFVPIFVLVFLYLLLVTEQKYHWNIKKIKLSQKIILSVLVLIGLVGMGERYGLNMIRYKTPLPECDQVIGVDRCWQYGPWRRNYVFAHSKDDDQAFTAVTFTRQWLKVLSRSTFYVLNGPGSNYKVGEPLNVIWFSCLIGGCFGIILALRYMLVFLKRFPGLGFMCLVTVVYAVVLWLQNYADYRHLGRPVALQGRYLLPVLPIFLLLLALGYSEILRQKKELKSLLVVLGALFLTQGGGFVTFLVRSDATWYRDDRMVKKLNETAKVILKPLVFKG